MKITVSINPPIELQGEKDKIQYVRNQSIHVDDDYISYTGLDLKKNPTYNIDLHVERKVIKH